MDFTKQLSHLYSKMGIKTTSRNYSLTYVEPIIPLSPEQEEQLLKGDGQRNENEYKQINSSTGLAVNFYKILESTGKIKDLQFEEKVAKPLRIRGGRPANLDVTYIRDGKRYYIESKYLEPYYSGNEHNSESYFKKEYYDVPENDKNAWYNLFFEAQKYKLYNFSQLCRHLLAIWRKHQNEKDLTIVFQSVTWRMPDSFINRFENNELKDSFLARRNGIDEESKLCQKKVNDFLQEIGWNNITLECLHYNDMLGDISSSDFVSDFKMRYFL